MTARAPPRAPPPPSPDVLSGGAPLAQMGAAGGRLVAGQHRAPLQLAGVLWPGFGSSAAFVALPAARNGSGGASWEASDFAASVTTLRLLGFNAVALPFDFGSLGAAPADAARPCPGLPPNTTQLAARVVGALGPPGAAKGGEGVAPPQLAAPAVAATPGTCNGYVPRGPTRLARLLWSAEYLVRAGVYVVLAYDPPAAGMGSGAGGGGDGGGGPLPPELSSPQAFASSWARLGAALACLPAWRGLQGRVALGLLAAPGAHGLGWQGGGDAPPLGEYYLSALDALAGGGRGGGSAGAGGGVGGEGVLGPGTLFLVAGAPSTGAHGGGFGSSFAAGADAAALGVEDAGPFLRALAGRHYAGRVVAAPVMAAPSVAGAPTAPAPQLRVLLNTSWCGGSVGEGAGPPCMAPSLNACLSAALRSALSPARAS